MVEYLGDRTDSNYETSWGVRSRFFLYTFYGQSPELFETEIVGALKFQEIQSILEVGASDGTLLRYVGDYAMRNSVVLGLEPNSNQFTNRQTVTSFQRMNASLIELGLRNQEQPERARISLQPFSAEDIAKLPKNSVDVLMAFYMLYHLNEENRAFVYEQSKRVLSKHGLLFITTSGERNKNGHREIEEELAATFKVTPPPHMNSRFTTEQAEVELPKYFEHVYEAKACGRFSFLNKTGQYDPVAQMSYEASLLSLMDQCSPALDPNDERVRTAVSEAVFKRYLDDDFNDEMHRSLFIVSKKPLEKSPFISTDKIEIPLKKISKS